MESRLNALAARVRQTRESYGLSLAELADRCGIAKATLFKIERSRTNPTLETLVALADAFSMDVVDLLAVNDDTSVVEVVRHDDPGQDVSDDSVVGRIVKSIMVGSTLVEVHDLRFLAGHSETSISHGTGVREHVIVRTGRILVGPVGSQEEVRSGDYATYMADRPHRWTPVGRQDAHVWVVHCIPRMSPHPTGPGAG